MEHFAREDPSFSPVHVSVATFYAEEGASQTGSKPTPSGLAAVCACTTDFVPETL